MTAQHLSAFEDQSGTNVVRTDGATIMDVIGRLAADPNADVDKLERMVGLYERLTDRQSIQAYNEAMNLTQAELEPVSADASNPQTKSKYASYHALDRAIRPVYTKHGFGVSFDTGDDAPADHVRVLCYVSHSAGDKHTHHIDMPSDGKGAKGGDVMTKTHATGAAVSYGRRYLLGMIFNIAVGDDDDGNSGSRRGQSAAVDAAFAAINMLADKEAFRVWKRDNADALKALPQKEADAIIRQFNERLRKVTGAQGQA